jgi:hypothetical protein
VKIYGVYPILFGTIFVGRYKMPEFVILRELATPARLMAGGEESLTSTTRFFAEFILSDA